MKKKNKRILEAAAAIIAMVIIVASLLLFNGLMSHDSGNAGKTPADNSTTTDGNTNQSGMSPGTGLAAYATAINDFRVTDWTNGKHNVSVVSISTDSSNGGTAQDWKIVLDSDEAQTTFYVEDGGVVNAAAIRDDYGTEPAIDTSKVINSDRAWSIAAAEASASVDITSLSPMTLRSIGNNTYWDVYFIGETQRQIVRIDALNGSIVQNVSSGGD
ncbi:MAG TPA: hypothetical protein VK436_08590 [Methanocella sp.]|nr:hypothetical protein [Methanocella sp.]